MLHADSIGISFGTRRVLSSARIEASSGEVTGLLGRMGTGKSTLLKVCAGIVQPDSGWVQFDGVRYHRARRTALARRGMFYLGESANLASGMTLRQHFDLVEKRFGAGDREGVIELLAVSDLIDARIESLSTGELRRAEMALALLRRPLCLLADEAFRSLDPIVCETIGTSLRRLAVEGCAVVVTGHEVETLKPFLDSVTWVTSGTTYSLGNVESAWKNERFTREYLGALPVA
ncbi:MAG: ATP-binding cassette domain-containing protein [Gemmatimonadales bacterium]